MSDEVSIAVITCTFNSSATIRRNIQSVNEQIYKNYRHIFIDGASEDETVKIIQDCAKNPLLLSEKDDGLFHAFNRGLDACCDFDVFGFLHSDDHFVDGNCLERIAEAFRTRPEAGYYCSKVICFSPQDGEILDVVGRNPEQKTVWRYLRRSNEYAHPSYYCRTELARKVGYFDTQYRIAADIDWILRLENLCPAFFFDPRPLVKMRAGGNSASDPNRAFYEEYSIFRKFGKRKFNLFFFFYYLHRSALKKIFLKMGWSNIIRLVKKMMAGVFGD